MKRRALLLLFPAVLAAKEKKLSNDDRMALLRGLTAEYAKAKTLIPRSKKALPIEPNGKWDREVWEKANVEFGPAARVGEIVQITKVHIEDARIDLELNNGLKTGAKWYEHVQVGVGNSTAPISGGNNVAKAGTNLDNKAFADSIVAITGAAYDYAKPGYSTATLDFGNVRVGASPAAQTVAFTNAAVTDANYQEGLKVVATGGLAPLFSEGTTMIQHIVPDLTLDGLRMLAERNPAPALPRDRSRLADTD